MNFWCFILLSVVYSNRQYPAPEIQNSKENRSRKVAWKPRGIGERWVSEACKHCFEYLIPVYQLLEPGLLGFVYTKTKKKHERLNPPTQQILKF